MSQIHQAGLEAQRRHALTPERRKAWKEFREADRRIAMDLLFLQTEADVFGEQTDGDSEPKLTDTPKLPEVGPPPLETLIAAFGVAEKPALPEPLPRHRAAGV